MTTVTKEAVPVQIVRAYESAMDALRSMQEWASRCPEGCTWEEAIEEEEPQPLSVETHKTYEILLSWGGPAVRIVGNLEKHHKPETADLP